MTTAPPVALPVAPPVTRRVILKDLPAAVFQHPLDKQATAGLATLKGFNWLVAKFLEYGVERALYAQYTGSSVRVSPKQFSRLYAMLRESCAVLDVPEPALYVMQAGDINAFTSGHNNPFIVVNTGLLELLDDDEILGILAHELGHIKCGHVLYMQMARFIGPLLQAVGSVTLGVGKLVGMGVESALLIWSRRAELSADRAALLVLQDARPCVTMLMRLAGGSRRWMDQLDPEQFLNQARAYREGMDQNMTDRIYRFLGTIGTTHPVCVERAREVDEYANSQEYRDILAGKYTRIQAKGQKACPTCGFAITGSEKFCPQCATPLAM